MSAKILDKDFVYKPYTKQELAQLYLPYNAPSTAVKKFNIWLRHSPQFWNELQKAGIGRSTRSYTARQVQMIVEHLGEP